MKNIGSGLERANRAFNDAIGSYEHRVRPSGERLIDLGGSDGAKKLATLNSPREPVHSPTPLEQPDPANG